MKLEGNLHLINAFAYPYSYCHLHIFWGIFWPCMFEKMHGLLTTLPPTETALGLCGTWMDEFYMNRRFKAQKESQIVVQTGRASEVHQSIASRPTHTHYKYCVLGGTPCAVRALCEKLAVFHHQ